MSKEIGDVAADEMVDPNRNDVDLVQKGATEMDPEPAGPGVEVLPDLVGLSESDAIERLSAIGLPDPNIVEQQQLGEAGVILKQQPVPGSEASGTMTLTVRTELPPLPSYTGRQATDVVAELERWGVQVVSNSQVDETRPGGEVLDSVPIAGSEIGQQVELTVAAAPVTLYLSDEEAPLLDVFYGEQGAGFHETDAIVDRDQSVIAMDGSTFANSTWIDYPWTRDEYVGQAPLSMRATQLDFLLGRDWSVFRATAGIGDSSQDVQARFRVIVDNEVVEEHTIAIGSPVEIDVSLEGALRLRLEVEPLIIGRGYYVWGDARLVGVAPSE